MSSISTETKPSTERPRTLVAGVEGGGTSWKVGLGWVDLEDGKYHITERSELIPTTTPGETLTQVNAYLLRNAAKISAVGIACFGPIDPDVHSPTFGFITESPKKGWNSVNVVKMVMAGLEGVPCGFDTDVNAPAMAEYVVSRMAQQHKSSCAYITLGTGVGVGLVVNGATVHGLLHPEGGHISVPRFRGDDFEPHLDNVSLQCPNWCEVESFAAKHSIEKRFAGDGPVKEVCDIPKEDPVFEAAAHYVACLCANIILLVSPEKIVIGGGIMGNPRLLPMIRTKCLTYLNNYIKVPELRNEEACQHLIAKPTAGADAGLLGALLLGAEQARKSTETGSHAQLAAQHNRCTFSPIVVGVACLAAGVLLGRLTSRSNRQ